MGRLDNLDWGAEENISPTGQGSANTTERQQIVYMKPEKMVPYQDEEGRPQRFHELSSEELELLAVDLQHNGMIDAVHLVQVPSQQPMIFIGHNRWKAEKLRAELFSDGETREIPCIIHNAEDPRIAALLVSSNLLRREKLFPSERAYAYAQLQKSYSVADIAKFKDTTRKTVYYYLELNRLHPTLLIKVDKGEITVDEGHRLSLLPQDIQVTLYAFFEEYKLGKIKEEHITLVKNFLQTTDENGKKVYKTTELSKDDYEALFVDYLTEKQDAQKSSARKKAFVGLGERVASFYPEDCAPEKIEGSITLILERLKNEGKLDELIAFTMSE